MSASLDVPGPSILQAWCAYWFPPVRPARVRPLRIAIGAVAAAYFASYFSSSSLWFGPEGVLHTSLAGKFVTYEQLPRWQAWSPLWWTDQLLAYQVWLGLGILWALATASGFGGRWAPAVLALWLIAWAHRLSWLAGAAEPALIAMVAYLIVEPGPSLSEKRDEAASWQAGLTLRLVQTHLWLLLAAGLLSQLASLIWWRGDAIWWLAEGGRSHLLSVEGLRENALWINFLTHACVLVQALALWLLITSSGRRLGIALAVVSCLIVGLIADFGMYALVLAAGLLAFAYFSAERQPEAS